MKLPSLQVDEQTVLKPPRIEWAEEVFELIEANRAYLEPWLDWLASITTIEHTRLFLFDAIRFNEGGQRCTYLIVHRNQIVGFAALLKVDYKHHKAELGFWIAEKQQGQGIVSKACRKLLHYAFADLCLNRIVLKTMQSNQSSKAVAERIGLAREGQLRQAFFHQGTYRDLELYSILRKEWKKL
jgi:ribosomal-protein-serine acetyltransferase